MSYFRKLMVSKRKMKLAQRGFIVNFYRGFTASKRGYRVPGMQFFPVAHPSVFVLVTDARDCAITTLGACRVLFPKILTFASLAPSSYSELHQWHRVDEGGAAL